MTSIITHLFHFSLGLRTPTALVGMNTPKPNNKNNKHLFQQGHNADNLESNLLVEGIVNVIQRVVWILYQHCFMGR